jgi:hypothetical protein
MDWCGLEGDLFDHAVVDVGVPDVSAHCGVGEYLFYESHVCAHLGVVVEFCFGGEFVVNYVDRVVIVPNHSVKAVRTLIGRWGVFVVDSDFVEGSFLVFKPSVNVWLCGIGVEETVDVGFVLLGEFVEERWAQCVLYVARFAYARDAAEHEVKAIAAVGGFVEVVVYEFFGVVVDGVCVFVVNEHFEASDFGSYAVCVYWESVNDFVGLEHAGLVDVYLLSGLFFVGDVLSWLSNDNVAFFVRLDGCV